MAGEHSGVGESTWEGSVLEGAGQEASRADVQRTGRDMSKMMDGEADRDQPSHCLVAPGYFFNTKDNGRVHAWHDQTAL